MSATPKKMAQPRKSQPSTLMLVLLPLSAAQGASGTGPDRLALRRVTTSTDMRVMQVESRALRPDPRDRGEVVTRWRAGRRPFERIAESPRVVLDHPLAVLPRLVHVVEEEQVGHAEYERADRRHLVQRCGHVRQERVVGRAPRLADHAKPVLHQEGRVETDEHEPEVPLTERFVEFLAGPLRPPEVEAAEHAEHDRAEQHVVEVRHDEVRVTDREVKRRRRQDDPGQAAEQEDDHDAEYEQHRRLEAQLTTPD